MRITEDNEENFKGHHAVGVWGHCREILQQKEMGFNSERDRSQLQQEQVDIDSQGTQQGSINGKLARENIRVWWQWQGVVGYRDAGSEGTLLVLLNGNLARVKSNDCILKGVKDQG